MSQRVGIPRAMGYYYFYPFFHTLLRELGAEPVLSPPTNPQIMERMDICPTDEPCLAVKLHFSHADYLVRHGNLDCLLLPVIERVDNTPCCPKFIGVADMICHGLRLPADFVLAPALDFTSNPRQLTTALAPLARRLSAPHLAAAIRTALETQRQCSALCVDRQLTIPEAYRVLLHGAPAPVLPFDGTRTAVIGHPYILYEMVSQNMIDRLRQHGPVVTAEMVAPDDRTRALTGIAESERLWPFEGMLLGAALHLLHTGAVDKMILVGSFECGPESIIESYVVHEAQRRGIPLMVLALDEHSGEAGLSTRLEAFMDTEKVATTPTDAPPTPHVVARDEMILGVPSMGYLDVAICTFAECCGVRALPTAHTTRHCIELGREIAPEFVCFPFVATLGQMRDLLDRGANTLLMVGGKGYCRLGWYAQVQEALLRDLGYNFQMLIVDSPFPLREKLAPFKRVLQRMTGGASWPTIIAAFQTGLFQMYALDHAERLAHRLRAFERDRGATDRLVSRYIMRLSRAREIAVMRRLEREFEEEAATIVLEDTDPLRIRIVGEIWVVLEQTATRDVERWLAGRNHPRVWIDREHSASHWFQQNVWYGREARKREETIVAAARPWLRQRVGGHGQQTIGQTVLARAEGMDGVLHIFPFTCMPEIIAQNLLVRISDDYDIPVLTYIVSEQAGEAGMETRLESFLDVLEERRLAVRESRGASIPTTV